MEENITQPEETAAVDASVEADFEAGFADDGELPEAKTVEETPEEENDNVADTPDAMEPEETALEVDGKKFTPDDIKTLLNRQPELPKSLVELARNAGMTPEQYLQAIEDGAVKQKTEARVAQLMEQGVEESIARHLAEVEQENERYKQETARGNAEKQSHAEFQKHIEEFDRLYPDVKELPQEVIDDITKTGVTPVTAYQRYLLSKQETELKTLRQEKKNRESTPGKAKGQAETMNDPFLAEFMKD